MYNLPKEIPNHYTSLIMETPPPQAIEQSNHHIIHHKHKHKQRNSAFRMLFFILVFCISGLIVYFALGHIYGFGPNAQNLELNAHDHKIKEIGLFKRSISTIDDDDDQRTFLLIVFCWKRKASLKRLVDSLIKADYSGHFPELQFHIEFDPSEEVKAYVNNLKWPHGNKKLFLRQESFGLEKMVMTSWNATKDSEFAFFFEDDIEVQPQYFKYTLKAMERDDISKNDSVIGVALNTPRYDEVNLKHSIWLPEIVIGKQDRLFLFQQPCSWGALYFPWKWREYLKFYSKRNLGLELDIVPQSCIFKWQRSWKKYLMELMVLEGYVMLYPSLPDQQSLSINHREPGEHTNIEIEHALVNELNPNVVDYFVVPMAKAEQIKLLMESLSTIKNFPLVSFYHFKVNSIKDLIKFGKIIKYHRLYENNQK